VLHGMKRQAETAARLRLGKAGTALGRAHEFSSEEIELLIAAAERGEFIIIGADQIGNWIRAGQSDFVNFDDRETAARYFDAFNALMKSGLAHREAEDYYVLTGRGFKVARELRAEHGGDLHNQNTG
jgi:hypothetical protein